MTLTLLASLALAPSAMPDPALPSQIRKLATEAVVQPGEEATVEPACGTMVIRRSSASAIRIPIVAVVHTTLGTTHQFWLEGFRGNTSYLVIVQNIPLGGFSLSTFGGGPSASLSIDDGSLFGNPNYSERFQTIDAGSGGFGDGVTSFSNGRSAGYFRFGGAKPGEKKVSTVVEGQFDSH